MALNVIFSDIESERRVEVVGNNVAPGSPRRLSGRSVVTLTGSGDWTNGLTSTGNTVINKLLDVGVANGGIGLRADEATVTPTGTYAFDVTGASVATARGTLVYITAGNVLTLTSSGNTLFGKVEFFRGKTSATDTAVTIGVNLG